MLLIVIFVFYAKIFSEFIIMVADFVLKILMLHVLKNFVLLKISKSEWI